MADRQAAWGIDIGQAGLKAVRRLKYAEAAGQVMAVAFDYVPHAKILSQPDAKPDELIAQALQTFLSRNQVKGDAIVVSVPGQTALARFISLPPVDQNQNPRDCEVRSQATNPLRAGRRDLGHTGAWQRRIGGRPDSRPEVGLFA